MKIDKTGQGMRRRIDQAIQDLEKKVGIVKTGEYRRSRQGIPEPVYATRELYEQVNLNCRIREVAEPGPKLDCPSARGPNTSRRIIHNPALPDKLGRKMHDSMRVCRDQFERCPDCL